MEISIIIPVYNAASFLHRCLDSLLVSGIESMEILLINDGSTDSSGEICERYAKKDSRVSCVHQQNQGAVVARNNGLANAQGNYVLFVDADDYVSDNYVRNLYEHALRVSADIVFCNLERVKEGKCIEKTHYTVETRTLLKDKMALVSEIYYPGAYAKIYRKKLFDDGSIQFLDEEGYFGFAEDILLALQTTYAAREVAFCSGATYYYSMDNSNSICSKFSVQMRNNNDRLIIIDKLITFSVEKRFNFGETLPILQAVENHLQWGGVSTTNIFLAQLDEKQYPTEIKEHFKKFALELKKSETFSKKIKSKIKNFLFKVLK